MALLLWNMFPVSEFQVSLGWGLEERAPLGQGSVWACLWNEDTQAGVSLRMTSPSPFVKHRSRWTKGIEGRPYLEPQKIYQLTGEMLATDLAKFAHNCPLI